jgi:ketosteroid isomerase-like protein
MSQTLVDIFRNGIDAFRRGDWDAVAATLDPNVLVRTDPRWPEQRFYGREAVVAFFRGLWESWGPDARIQEIVDLGDRLLIRWRYIVRGQHSGVEGEQHIFQINTYREGRVILFEYFLEREQALAALEMPAPADLGLDPQADTADSAD